MEVNKKEKIALCFFGYVGAPFTKSVDIKNHHYEYLEKKIFRTMTNLSYIHAKKFIIDSNPEYDFDIFIHSWSVDVENEIVKKFKPKKYIVEKLIAHKIMHRDGTKYLDDNKNNNLSRLLGAFKVTNLLNEYSKENNINYKQVILTRFDMAWMRRVPIKEYLNNNIKIIDAFHKGSFVKKENINFWSNDKLKEVNEKYSNKNLKIDFDNYEFKIMESLFMSNIENIVEIGQLYHKVLKLYELGEIFKGKKIGRFWSCHFYYANCLLDVITKGNIEIQKITELYAEGINENDEIPENATVLYLKQMYFRNPAVSCNYGTINGNIEGRLVDVRTLLDHYKLPENIIKKCE